jgi:hypothetical protein
MKKVFIVASAFAVACLLIVSCSKKNDTTLSNPGGGNNGGGGSNPPPTCDTVNMKYAANVVPILSGNCYSCHSGSNPSSGIRLDSYANLKSYASSGTLTGVINHSPGYPAMPEGGGKLSDCDINTIQDWINNGIQNN